MIISSRAMARVLASVAALALSGAIGVGADPPPAAAEGTGAQVRLGHFAPGVPQVDVYLSAVGSEQRLVLPDLGYGEVSQYLPVAPGRYTYAMRRAGRPGTAPKLLSGVADLSADRAYTFIAFDDGARVRTIAFGDDNSTPAAGSARIRLINTAAGSGAVDVTAVNGPALADRLRVGATSDYATVPGGTWQVRIRGARSVQPVEQTLEVPAGTVQTLVVVNGPATPRIISAVDATGIAGTTAAGLPTTGPVGGVPTGGGGTARAFVASDDRRPPVVGIAAAVAGLGIVALTLGHRRRSAS